MKILVDMNLTPRWTDALSRRGLVQCSTELETGALVTVEVNKTRLRILPLN
jgi:predicted nuclease of predicted toxin-antitoxin system